MSSEEEDRTRLFIELGFEIYSSPLGDVWFKYFTPPGPPITEKDFNDFMDMAIEPSKEKTDG